MSELYGFKKNLEKVQVRSKSESAAKSHLVPTLIDGTPMVCRSGRYDYTNRTIPELANWNVVALACKCGNIQQNIICFRGANTVNHIVDSLTDTVTRALYYVDWVNNRIRIRWDDGNASLIPSFVQITAVYGLVQNVNVVDQDTEDEPSDEGEDIDITGLTEEIQGIRIGADGTIYDTAGEAVREQYNKLAERLDLINADDVMQQINDAIAAIPTEVETWLDEHPEATTTVQDGAITEAKLSDALKLKTIKDYVTPEMFGAVGDGITDDTDAIQMALDTGKTVYFYNKTYRCENLSVNTPCLIIGEEGATLKITDTVEIPSYESYTENTVVLKIVSNDVKISNITLDGNYAYLKTRTEYDINAKFSSYGIRVKDASNVHITNCKIDNVKDAGIQLTANCTNIIIEHNVIGKNGPTTSFNRGIQCLASETAKTANYIIKNNYIYNSGEHGIVVYTNNDNTVIDGNIVINSGLTSVNPSGSTEFINGACIKLSECGNVIISNNHCVNGLAYGILATSDYKDVFDVIISNNRVVYTDDAEIRGSGISVSVDNVVVSGNVVNGVLNSSYLYAAGIYCRGDNDVINGNIVYNCDNCITCQGNNGVIVNNHLNSIGKATIVCTKARLISNNVIVSNRKDGVDMTDGQNTIICSNFLKNHNRGMVFRKSADNINIYGNLFDTVSVDYNWLFGTPTNSKIDFVAVS